MMTMRELNIGEFQECNYGLYFTYRNTDNLWAIEQGYMHEIDVGDCQVRFARVLKTVAYICTDEDASGYNLSCLGIPGSECLQLCGL
jgi:hypothetical protein